MSFKKIVTPYYDYIVFVVVLLLSNALWKICVRGEDSLDAVVTLLGTDITSFFQIQMQHIAKQVFTIVHIFKPDISYDGLYTIFLARHHCIGIVWGCTPVKQAFIFLCLMLSVSPQSWHKTWYIPLGWAFIYGVNIWRIAIITIMIIPHPEWFEVLHTYIFKLFFYGIIFLMWLLWVKLNQHQTVS